MDKIEHKADPYTNTLQELGLSENEAVLYTLMLSHPRSTVQELSTRAPFPRTMLYYVLKQLAHRGIVTESRKGSRTLYIAEDPERLYDLLAHKEREFEREAGAIRVLIPQLKNRYRLAGTRPTVRIFEGVDEYQKALEGVLITKPREILSYEMLGKKRPALGSRDEFDAKRARRRIKKKVLFFDGNNALQYVKTRPYDDYTQFRSMSEAAITPFETDLSLYDNKVLYTSYNDELELTAVLIEDANLYMMQKNLFESFWRKGRDRTLAFTEKV